MEEVIMPTENLESKRTKIEVEENDLGSNQSSANQPKVSSGSNIDAVKNGLNEIDRNYENQYPVYEEMEATLPDYKDVSIPTQDEIVKEAEGDLAEYKVAGTNEIVNQYQNDFASLNLEAMDCLRRSICS